MNEEQAVANQVIQSAQKKQPTIVRHFQQVLAQSDLSHAYLFSGENGSGKMAVALMIAMAMFCPNVHDEMPCGHCNECLRIASHQHPDVVMIEPEGQNIKIDRVRFLKAEFSKSAVEGNQKIFIIDDADRMTNEAANSLLKFIEEPTGHIVSFLLTDNKLSIIPTILSRTQVVEFPSLRPELFNQELMSVGINQNQFNLISTMTNNLTVAQKWNQDRWFVKLQDVVAKWFDLLVHGDRRAFVLMQTDILPLVSNFDEQVITINMMIQAWRDVLNVKFRSSQKQALNFPTNNKDVMECSQRISIEQLLQIMNLLLKNNVYLEHYVSFQNIIEATTLEILSIIHA